MLLYIALVPRGRCLILIAELCVFRASCASSRSSLLHALLRLRHHAKWELTTALPVLLPCDVLKGARTVPGSPTRAIHSKACRVARASYVPRLLHNARASSGPPIHGTADSQGPLGTRARPLGTVPLRTLLTETCSRPSARACIGCAQWRTRVKLVRHCDRMRDAVMTQISWTRSVRVENARPTGDRWTVVY